MFINKSATGLNNICGPNIRRLRRERGWSQYELAAQLQLLGLVIEKNSIQRMESGKRFVTDIELVYLSAVFETTIDNLMDYKIPEK